jgi:hypothetical protein
MYVDETQLEWLALGPPERGSYEDAQAEQRELDRLFAWWPPAVLDLPRPSPARVAAATDALVELLVQDALAALGRMAS